MEHKCPICNKACNQDKILPSEVRGQRISRALIASQAAGFKIGRPKEFDYEKAKVMRSKGFSFRKIAAELGCSHPAVYRALKQA